LSRPNRLSLGAKCLGSGRCRFRVWAPRADTVEVRLLGARQLVVPLTSTGNGYFQAELEEVAPNSLYFFRLNPTPAPLRAR
jgi:maltooligosyltrehalose trehalohydrolase